MSLIGGDVFFALPLVCLNAFLKVKTASGEIQKEN